MGKLIKAQDGAARVGITSQRFRVLCRQRRIVGARNIAGHWFVPEDFVITPEKPGPKPKK